MKPTIQQLESFYWTARLGSIHAAARHQNLTQPAVTCRLRELEDVVGSKLFDRSRYRVELTSVGRGLLVYAEKILQLTAELITYPGLRDPIHGLLRLGANESSAMMGLTTLLARIKELYPGLKVELTVDVGANLSRKLNARELDIAILTDPASASHVVDEPLGSATLKWIASAAHPFSGKQWTPKDLAELPVFTLPPPSSLYLRTVEWFQTGGCPAGRIGYCNSMALILELIAAGHAVSIMPLPVVRRHLERGVVRALEISTALPTSTYFISYLQDVSDVVRTRIAPVARDVFNEAGLLDA